MVLILMIMTIVECSASTNKHIPGCKTTPAYLSTAQPKVSFFLHFIIASVLIFEKVKQMFVDMVQFNSFGRCQRFPYIAAQDVKEINGICIAHIVAHCSSHIVLVKNTISTISWLSNMPSSKLPPSYKVCTGKTHD